MNAIAVIGRAQRDADSIVQALADNVVVEPHAVLDAISAWGASKQLDREFRKTRPDRDFWLALDTTTASDVVELHVGVRVALLCHPNGRVRMTAVQQCAEQAFPVGTLRTMVHRCTDHVEPIAELAQEIVGQALITELERPNKGALLTPLHYPVMELLESAALVERCPDLVLQALELHASSWQPRRRTTVRIQHRRAQLARYLHELVVDGPSEVARLQLIEWLSRT